LRHNAKRQGVAIIDSQVGDASDKIANASHESFDIVLIDAPCSGIGTMRRNPELKWRLSDETINEMVILQKTILKNAALYVKKGGRLVYCTCSTLPVENERIIGDFIARNSNFARIHPPAAIHASMIDNRGYLRTYPHRHQMDGFFGAVLVKEPERKGN
jgi:16S rRNA (cytosine967-C5)-methyltransferase